MDGRLPEEQKMTDPAPEAQEDRVFFDQPAAFPRDQGDKRGLAIGLVIIVLLLAALGGWFFLIRGKGGEVQPAPTPFVPIIEDQGTPAPTTIDRSSIRFEILNGTGIAGEAAFLKDKLEDAGYSNLKVGNSTNQDRTQTEVAFSTSVPEEVKTEIKTLLEGTYKDVTTTTLTQNELDVRVITGLRRGATPKPTATATPKPSSSPSPSASPTISPVPTATP